MHRSLLAATAAMALLPAASAMAGTKYYFTCSANKVEQTTDVGWSTTAPASVQTGAGCGQFDPSLLRTGVGAKFDFYGGGELTGPVDALTFELDALGPVSKAELFGFDVQFDLLIDGDPVADNVSFKVPAVASSTGASEAYRFTVRREPQIEVDENGDEIEIPVPLIASGGPHTVSIRYSPLYLNNQNHVWVWGASEVPAGVEVNPAAPAPTVYSVQ